MLTGTHGPNSKRYIIPLIYNIELMLTLKKIVLNLVFIFFIIFLYSSDIPEQYFLLYYNSLVKKIKLIYSFGLVKLLCNIHPLDPQILWPLLTDQKLS